MLRAWTAIATILLVLLLTLCAWFRIPRNLWNFYLTWKAVRHVPGLPTHWLYGNLHQIQQNEAFLKAYRKSIAENGWKLSRIWYGPFIVFLVIHHNDPLKKILKSPKTKFVYDLLKPWLGEGLLVAQGEKWHRNRRLLAPAFHFSILKQYVSIYNDCLDTLIRKWRPFGLKKQPVRLFNSISVMSLDIISQCAFSYKSEYQGCSAQAEYLKAVLELSVCIAERFITPLYHIDWLYWLTPHGKRMKRLCKLVHNHAEMVIAERKKALGLDEGRVQNASVFPKHVSERRTLDFLDILLTAVDEDGAGLTDLEVRDEVDTFMFAGHDTTTSGMCWTLYCLAKHPEHQEKVREEVRNVLKERRRLEYNDLKDLKYTQWCIKEAMRLYTPVDSIFRELQEDMELDGQWYPKGMLIQVPIHTVHYNPLVWPNPEVYDPLRFNPVNAEGRDPYAYLPFSAGYRNCIGQMFALNEARTVVASIVHHFRLSVDEDHHVEVDPKIIHRAVNDIQLKLEPLIS